MPEQEPVFWPIDRLVQAFRDHELSPVEVTQEFLTRIEQFDDQLHTYLSISPDLALRQAREAEAAYRSGEATPPLLGVPLSIKDLFDVEGEPTTLGSRAMESTIADRDSHAVSLLRAAGATFLGKSNTAEFGQSATTANKLGPECGNPWDPRRTPGGSSGGSAAGVAAGLATGSLGSDGGGSIRIPAAMCGLVGIKPTWSELPKGDAFRAMTRFVCAGPITRTVADARALLSVQLQRSLESPKRSRPLRIAWSPNPEGRPIEAGIQVATQAAIVAMSQQGHVVEQIELPIAGWPDAFGAPVLADEWQYRGQLLDEFSDELTSYVRKGIEAGRSISQADVDVALAEQALLRTAIDNVFADFDVIICPTTAAVAFPFRQRPLIIDNQEVDPLWGAFPFTAPFNVTGSPAASVPVGLSEGLPVGLQVVGPHNREDLVLDVCAEVEALMSFPNDEMVRRWSGASTH